MLGPPSPVPPAPIRVLLATDSALIADGLTALLADADDVQVVGRVGRYDELLDRVGELAADALIVSFRPGIASARPTIETARRLRGENPDLATVVIADRRDGFALELLRGGAGRVAYLHEADLSGIEAVLGALRDIRDGRTVLDPAIVDALVRRRDHFAIDELTVRETQVLEQLALGLSNPAIAAVLNLSVKAIEKHVTAIFRKLGLDDPARVDRRVTAALMFQRDQAPAPAGAPGRGIERAGPAG